MSIVVEDGTGLTNSDAYISVADADTYHTNYTGSASWSAASTAVKEIAIRNATQYLDLKYGQLWHGRRTNETQALDWPRYGLVDKDGYPIDFDEMPTSLTRSCAELSSRHVDGDTLIADVATTDGGIKSEAVSVGSVSSDVTYVGTKPTAKKYTVVQNFIASYIGNHGRIARG